jgi:hypothetical protein
MRGFESKKYMLVDIFFLRINHGQMSSCGPWTILSAMTCFFTWEEHFHYTRPRFPCIDSPWIDRYPMLCCGTTQFFL